MVAWRLNDWDIFVLSSATAEWNTTKLEGSNYTTSFYVFRAVPPTKMPPWHVICRGIVDFSFIKDERSLTKLDRKQKLNAAKYVFYGCNLNKDGRPGLRLAVTFSTSPLNRWKELCQILSENVLYKGCIIGTGSSTKMTFLFSDWLRHFRLHICNRWTEFDETWQEASIQRHLPFLGFSRADASIKMAALTSDLLRHFRLLLSSRWTEFDSTWKDESSQRPPSNICFRVVTLTKIVILVFDWLRQFRLLLCDPWKEFDWTWQETITSTQRPLQRLYSLDGSFKKMAALGSDWSKHFRISVFKRWTEFDETLQ